MKNRNPAVILLLLGALLTVAPQSLVLRVWDELVAGGSPLDVRDAGLRVLITYRNDGLADLPESQRDMLQSASLRTDLTAACAKGKDGSPEWRIWAVETTVNDTLPVWQKLMAVPRGAAEWIVIQNGGRGYSGPLPKTEAEVIALVRRYQ